MKELKIIALFLGFFVVIGMVMIFRVLSNIFIPLSFATLLALIFGPAVKKLTGYRIPKAIVLFILVVFIFAVFQLLGILIYSGVSSFVDEFPKYSAKMTILLTDISNKFEIPQEDMKLFVRNIDWKSAVNPSSVTSIITSTMGSFTNFLGKLMLVLLFMLFMLAGRGKLQGRLDKSLSQDKAQQAQGIIESIESQVQKYLVTKTLVSFLTAVLGMGILALFGVDFVILFGLLIFVFNFIPTFGSIIATLLPVLVCFLEYGLSWRVVIVGVCLMGLQMIIGNYVDPKLMGRGLNLSPLFILISLIFWGWVWGIMGMILAVPLTSAMRIVMEHIEPLKPVAAVISAE